MWVRGGGSSEPLNTSGSANDITLGVITVADPEKFSHPLISHHCSLK